MKKNEFTQLLKNGLESMELISREDLEEDLWLYANFLIEENKKYNLTAIDSMEEIISKHFLDSLVIFKKIEIDKGSNIIDVGTGAGFPGLLMKIYRPDLNILLLDSLSKRIRFLNKLIDKLELKAVHAIHGRAEELASNEKHREKYDIAVSRAVASINILSEYTIPFVNTGGKIIFFKGPDYQEEILNGGNAIKSLGGELDKNYKIEVPGLDGERYLVSIRKKTEQRKNTHVEQESRKKGHSRTGNI